MPSSFPESQRLKSLQALLVLERDEERARTQAQLETLPQGGLEAAGLGLSDLVVQQTEPALANRWEVSLTKRTQGKPIPWTPLRPGAPIYLEQEQNRLPGVVKSISRKEVRVLIGELLEDFEQGRYQLHLSHNEKVSAQQSAALQTALDTKSGRLKDLCQILSEPQRAVWTDSTQPHHRIEALNESQQQALQRALDAQDLALIQGPPGTGKTNTLAYYLQAEHQRGTRILATAPSNAAVDNLALRLAELGVPFLRLGHPARMSEKLLKHSLDYRVHHNEQTKVAKKMFQDAAQLRSKAGKFSRAKPEKGERAARYREARELVREARALKERTAQYILDSSGILLSTLSIDDYLLKDRQFDLLVVDEAGQATEPSLWPAILRCHRLVLVGDHQQLPPTVLSPQAAKEGLSKSLMEHCAEQVPDCSVLLKTQYRMHQDIMGFSNSYFYQDSLQAAEAVKNHQLEDLAGIEAAPWPEHMRFIDTAGAGYDEVQPEDGQSIDNPQEAELVVRYVQRLLAAGLPGSDIAVISPYAAQVRQLNELLGDCDVEIDTVDGFQGREKEAVVISMVRSNPDGQLGFLKDFRRMNVALTRAKRALVMGADSACLGAEPFYAQLIEYFERVQGYHTVWEEFDA